MQLFAYEDQIRAVPSIKLDPRLIEQMTDGERARLEDGLRRYRTALQTNPLLAYVPAGLKHYDFHESIRRRTKHRWIFGGNRAGKTTTTMVDNLIQAAPKHLIPPHLMQWKRWECPFYCRIVAPDMERTTKPVLHQKIKEWCPPQLFRDGDFDKSWHDKSSTLRLTCGCRFDFLSYEMGLNKFGGAALHRVCWDEMPPEDIRTESLMRLIDFDGDEIGAMTPLNGLDHIYRQVYKRRGEDYETEDRPRIRAWTIGIRDNRRLTEGAIESALSEIPSEHDRARREHGFFTELGGQVYPHFFKARRIRELSDADLRDDLLPRCNVYCAIDPGAAFAGITWHAFDSDNHDLVFDALKLIVTHAGDMARYLKAREARWDVKPFYVIDPAAWQTAQTNGRTVADELANFGIHCHRAVNDVEPGVWNVRWRLDAGALAIFEDLEELFDEAVEYSIEQRDDGVFAVVKKNDHLMDSLRYGVMVRPWIPTERRLIIPGGDTVARPPLRKPRHQAPEGALV